MKKRQSLILLLSFFVGLLTINSTFGMVRKKGARFVSLALTGKQTSLVTNRSFLSGHVSKALSNQITSQFKNHNSLNLATQREFSLFDTWRVITWGLRSPERKRALLFPALRQKIESDKSSFFHKTSIDEILEKIKNEQWLNESYKGSTPLQIAIAASTAKDLHEQKGIITTLIKKGARPDAKALESAIDHHNLGAIIVLQPYFEPMQLYQIELDFLKKIDVLLKSNEDASIDHNHILKRLQEVTDLLKRSVKRKAYCFSNVYNGREFEITFNASSSEEIKLFYDDIHNNFNSLNWQKSENNSFLPIDKKIENRYSNPLEQELYEFHVQLTYQKLDPKNIFAFEDDSKSAYLKLIQKYHPDRFDRENKEIQKMADEVCKELNRLYSQIK